MADYELPPLRIKIVGDGKSWEKTVEQTLKQAKQLATSLEKIGANAKASVVNKAVRSAVSSIHTTIASHITAVANNIKIPKSLGSAVVRRAVRDAAGNMLTHVALHVEQVATLTNRLRLGGSAQLNRTMREATRIVLHYMLINIRRMVVSAHSVRVAGAAAVNRTMRDANRLVLHYILINIRRMVVSAHNVRSAGSGQVNRVMRQAIDVILHSLLTRIRLMAVTAHNVRGNSAPLRQAVRSGITTIINFIIIAVRNTITQALAGISIRQFVANLRRGIQAGVNNTHFNPVAPNQRGGRRGGMGGMGGNGNSFLGDRADIYMHINAVRNLAAVWRSPLNALVEYQNKIATLAPQMGGMANAETFVRGMRNTQVGQTYGSEIATTATRLKPHMGEQEMQRMMEAVGDISGGDSERFKGLSRALGDVLSTGHLQGDELRQFQEQQFPLMDLLAKRTGKTTMELYKMMEKRQIPAKAIVELMKAETSQGGKYAGFLDSLSQTLGSAVQRVKTFYEALQVDVMKTVADQLVKYVNKLASGLVHITKWVNENQDLIKSYVELALKVSAAVVIFHAVGFAVAMVSWQMHALRRIMSILVVFTAIYNGVMRILTGTYWLLRVAVMATVASMFICRSVMAGLVATSAAISAGIGFLTAAVWTYTTTTRLATIATQIFAMTVGRSAIMSRVAALFALVFNGALNTIRATLAALRIGVVLTWLAFLWPVAAVIAAVLAIVGVINIAINSLGPAGFTGAIYGAWDSMKKFAINAIGFFMNIGHNSQVVAKYIYDNFWNMVQDTGTILGRLFANWASDSMLTFDTVAKLFGALMGWLVVNAPTWGYNIVNGLWTGFTWLFNKIKTGFAMVWEYATTGKLSEDFTNHLAGVGEAALKGATEGFLPAAAGIIAEHQKNSALLNNWGGMDLKSPAMEGLKFDWKTVDMLGLADKIPDIDFGAGAIPGMPNIDWSKLFGGQGGSDTKAGETATTPTTPMAVRAGSADHLDRVDAAMMAMGDPTAKTNAQIATNTGETNVILKQIQQSLVKPGSWSMKAEPAL